MFMKLLCFQSILCTDVYGLMDTPLDHTVDLFTKGDSSKLNLAPRQTDDCLRCTLGNVLLRQLHIVLKTSVKCTLDSLIRLPGGPDLPSLLQLPLSK